MKKLNKYFKTALMVVCISIAFTSCEDMNSRIDEQLDNINNSAEDIDSAVNRGLDQVENIDSTITAKSKRIKDLDSVVRKTTTRIDSLVNKNEINRLLN